MKRPEFVQAAKDNRISSRAYSLDGSVDENFCLENSGGIWQVYYFERGIKSEFRSFNTEDAALDQLFAMLLDDQSTRDRQ
ncbi:MAG: hypothetical protein ACKVT0_17740 [Planctomycetaceae bacterium]